MLLDMWLAEPVKAIIVPAEIFVSNPKGYPVLKKAHQAFIKKLMEKVCYFNHSLDLRAYTVQTTPYIALTIPPTQLHPMATPNSYSEYINFLNNHLTKMDPVEQFAFGYQDFLQNPLQPLMDNLDNSMYATFESDPIKYQEYENVSDKPNGYSGFGSPAYHYRLSIVHYLTASRTDLTTNRK